MSGTVGRIEVLPDPLALAHRLIVKAESELRGRTGLMILNEIVANAELDIGKLSGG